MKGLLFKELYLTRKTYLSFLVLFLGIASLCILIGLSMLYGNLRSMYTENQNAMEGYLQVFVYAPFAMLVFAVTAVEDSIYKDYASGWMKYSYTTAVLSSKAVGVRYLLGVIIGVASLVLGLGNAGIISLILNVPITLEMIKNMLMILLVAICYTFFEIPMALRFKTQQAVQSKVGIVVFFGYIFMAIYFYVKLKSLSAEMSVQYFEDMIEKTINIRDICLKLSVIIISVLFAVSFRISIKLYQRREKRC